MRNKKFQIFEGLSRAEDFYYNEEYKEALSILTSLIDFLDEDNIDVYYKIADIYSLLGDYEKSYNCYNEILKLEPEESGAWYGLGYVSEALDMDPEKSLSYYNKAIKYNNNYKEAYYYAATIYGDLEYYEMAEKYLLKAIELDPDDFVSENDLGAIYERQGAYNEAKLHVERSIAINSKYYMSYFNLGVIYERLNQDKNALAAYEKAKELSNNEYIYLNMSALFIRHNLLDEAREILNQGIKANKNSLLYYNRACVYSKLGNYEKAKKDIRQAMKLNDKVKDWMLTDPDLEFMKEKI